MTASVPFTGAVLKLRYGADFVAEEEVLGVDPRAAAEVLRESAFATALKPGTIAVSATMMSAYGLREGQRVTVSGPDGTVEATLLQGGLEWSRVVHPDVLAAVDQNAPPVGMLLRLDDGADVEDAMVQVKQAVASTDASVDGAAAVRQELDSILGVLVLVATSLLGVAVVIAVIGIANTLALSVLERGREHALLRGLGLTRGQLRGTLAVEGVLLATVSAVLGILLGIGYAWAGVQSLMPADTTAGLALPIGSLVAVVVLAVAAGLLASVLPARRAARIAPAAVLALP